MKANTIILAHRTIDGVSYYLCVVNKGKKSQLFHLMRKGSDQAFFTTIKEENAQGYLDAIGTNKVVSL